MLEVTAGLSKDVFLVAIDFAFTACAMWYALLALNKMGRHTNNSLRIAFVAIAAAAFSQAIILFEALWAGNPTRIVSMQDVTTSILLFGFALLAVYDRRERVQVCRGACPRCGTEMVLRAGCSHLQEGD